MFLLLWVTLYHFFALALVRASLSKKKPDLNDLMWMSWNGKRGEEPGHVLLDAEGGGAGGGQLPPPLHHHPRTVRQLITENTKNIRNAFFIVFVVVAHPVPTLHIMSMHHGFCLFHNFLFLCLFYCWASFRS